MTKKTLAASLAALAVVLSAGSALAATGYATQQVNVRAGAGTGYAIVGSLSAGEAVEVVECGGGWCLTEEGYVSSSYISMGGGYGGDNDEADEDDEDEEISLLDEDGQFDEDPLGMFEDIPQSLKTNDDDDFGDDDED
jgi:hypothetical protein